MNKLLLHPTTDYQMHALLQARPHAVLIAGGTGSGKQAITEVFIESILGDKQHNVLTIGPDGNSIGIEEIRKIRDFLNRKTTGAEQIRRIIFVAQAHSMTGEAQNALLKTLEEPPEDTMVILTVDDPTSLKQTIRSRTQLLLVLPVAYDDAEKFFLKEKYAKEAIQTAYFMSDGRVGLLKALLDEAKDHPLVAGILDAKKLLKAAPYDRLVLIDGLSKQKEQTTLLLQGLERVVTSGLRMAAEKKNEPSVKKFYELSKSIQDASKMLHANTNAKLVLTNLFLEV